MSGASSDASCDASSDVAFADQVAQEREPRAVRKSQIGVYSRLGERQLSHETK